MFFSKSIAFDEEDLGNVAVAAHVSSAYDAADLEYLERLKAGDTEAFDNLVSRYSGDVYALLFRLTSDAEEAGDLMQETFLNALRSIKSFRGDAELKTWLFRIAINQSRNRFRWWKRRKRDKTVSMDDPVGNSDQLVADTISDGGSTPEEALLRRERQHRIAEALGDMSAIYREVIVLCDIEGMAYEEIATTLEVNIGTVKSRIARGREELRKRLVGF